MFESVRAIVHIFLVQVMDIVKVGTLQHTITKSITPQTNPLKLNIKKITNLH